MKMGTKCGSFFIFMLICVCCGDDTQIEEAVRGACVLETDDGHGPNYCKDDSPHFSSCVDFLQNGSCEELGYDFCCVPYSGATAWHFLDESEAARAQELEISNCIEERTSCSTSTDREDSEVSEEDECRTNYDCPSRRVCKSGECVQVDCTNDAHCADCYRCSDNVCRYCGVGPYGCYC